MSTAPAERDSASVGTPPGRATSPTDAGAHPHRAIRVGVVIVNYNGVAHLDDCLDSLRACEPAPVRVLVVDNASTDDSVSRVVEWATSRGVPMGVLVEGARAGAEEPGPEHWLTLLQLTRQRGFSGGNNDGIRLLLEDAALTHVLLLNNDTVIAPDYFAELEGALRAAPDAGILSGTIYHFHERDRVWYAGGRSLPLRAMVDHHVVRPPTASPVPTEFVTGCAMVLSRALLERLGPLPECYFPAYMEDAEYSLRARTSGFEVLYAPGPVVYHKIGSTVGRATESPVAKFLETRHRVFYVRRNLRGPTRALALAYLLATKPARALVELLRGRAAMAGALWRGVLSGLLSPQARRESAPFAPRGPAPAAEPDRR